MLSGQHSNLSTGKQLRFRVRQMSDEILASFQRNEEISPGEMQCRYTNLLSTGKFCTAFFGGGVGGFLGEVSYCAKPRPQGFAQHGWGLARFPLMAQCDPAPIKTVIGLDRFGLSKN
jgi:hypothetical protein